jgi:hypothetical protein
MLRASPLALALALITLGACEADEAPPPATPQNATAEAPPPPAGPAQEAPPAAPSEIGAREYTIGEETDSYDDEDPAALTDFHSALDPYGSWADDPQYGTVWTPSADAAGPDFQPYVSSGHWTYDDDWTWVSDYPWGWAPFHYGRWVFVAGRGWVWIPGRAYRGAWVVWSVDDGWDYVGWAPAPPLFVWFGGAPIAWRGPYVGPRWVYCPHREVFAPGVRGHILAGPAAVSVAARMRVYTPSSPRTMSGPPPARLGYTAAEIPRAPVAAGNLQRAQQFARPSSAQPLGARAPAPARSYAPATSAGRWTGAQSGAAALGGGGRAAPSVVPRAAPAPRTSAPPRPAPVFRGGGGHFGGGHHR